MTAQTLSLEAMLALEAVQIDVDARDWRDAVTAAGQLLEMTGSVTADYTRAMVEAVEQLGPYIVLAPGLALAHAQASASVHRPALSVARLRSPVAFGHTSNDPVRLVVGLCSPDHETHMAALAELADALTDPDRRDLLASAPTSAALRDVLLTPHPRRIDQ